MGVFSTIKSTVKCPKCSEAVEWQSKRLIYDGIFVANAMQTITLNKKMDGEMHGFCDSCKRFTEVVIKKGKISALKSYKPKPLAKNVQKLEG